MQNPANTLLEVSMMYAVPRCLHVIAEMGVADVLGDAPSTAEEHWMGWSQQGREERVLGRKWSRWNLRQLQPAADIGAAFEARRKAWV